MDAVQAGSYTDSRGTASILAGSRTSPATPEARSRTRLASMLAGQNHLVIVLISSSTPIPMFRKEAEGNSWLMKRFQRVMPAAPT